MAGCGLRNRKVLGTLVVAGLLLAGAGIAWVERTALLAWFCVRGLARANESHRACWVERVACLGEAAVPGLLDCLARPDPSVCGNAREGLARLVAGWGGSDARSVALALRLARAFPHLSRPGQRATLEVAPAWFSERPARQAAAGLVPACARLLGESAAVTDPEVQGAALELAGALLALPHHCEALSAARDVTRAALESSTADNRLRAVRLTLCPGIDLLDQVVPLLQDPASEVRRAAVLALGPAESFRDEGLLPCLHDPDPEVRRLCEVALRGRGLRPEHLHLGRLLTDPSPVMRLRVLDHLCQARDLDPGIWLRRLSHDPSPAVRAAALRVMSQQTEVDLNDRIDQMARSDPSPTVCQLARYYLQQHRPTTRTEP
jgi:hypothetical protein